MPVTRALATAGRVDCTWISVIGEDYAWSDKNTGAQHRRLVDKGIILDLAVVTNPDAGAHVCTPTDVATAADDG
jgi:hypothetical protein